MATYNSFVFEGHGLSEVTGRFDPGAVNGSVTENALADAIVKAAKKYLDTLGLAIHYDENNYTDKDLAGNTYLAKCGIVVHINSAVGASGVEILVPCKETYLGADFAICDDIAKRLVIPNRGVKSRNYNTEEWYKRTNGVAINARDYFGEIGDAWNRGISLAILEVGFIQNDLGKMQTNIDYIGYCVAKYVAGNCGKELKPYSEPTVSKPSGTVYRVYVDGKKINAYGVIDNMLNEVTKAVKNGAKEIKLERV